MMTTSFSYDPPRMVFCDAQGRIFVHPVLRALGHDSRGLIVPREEEWIPLPAGSSFFYLPGHRALGFDLRAGRPVFLEEPQKGPVYPAAGFMTPGTLRLYLPAAEKTERRVVLPLWPYTAIGYRKGRFLAAALRVDAGRKQRPCYYADRARIKRGIARLLKLFPSNRLVAHLSLCALQYHCRNAQNLFLGRWEAPLPVSPSCNSRCLGCLSAQDTDCSSSHRRIGFVPSAQDVACVAIHHLKTARAPVVSFGQGCEGEPLLQFDVVADAVRRIRQATRRGTIHLNTNGFDARRLQALAACGLDSVRVSVVSFHPAHYEAYYRPRGYAWRDVAAAIHGARKAGLFVSLNYLTLPGFSDREDVVSRLVDFLKKGDVDLLQMRNLSIDPEVFWKNMHFSESRPVGMGEMVRRIRKACPGLRLGYFNPPKEHF
ncbi:MAG: radical SAM protein [Candidatus Omnitrophica bacterium]|nr:radical SAM protein [Candidatus Omnitrophota bacterium]MDD5574423.1 radical SAM protein [Candidatus Omnitrophota bacterium]